MRYVEVSVLFIVLIVSAVDADNDLSLNQSQSGSELDKSEARTENELTEEEIFIKAWGNYIGLWSFLIGIFVAPTFVTMAINPYMGRQSGISQEQSDILTKIAIIQNMWQRLNIKDPVCRKRVICEVYSGESQLGISVKNLAQAIYYISTNMPESFRGLFSEYIEAMRAGKQTKNCSRYAACSYTINKHG